MKDLFKTKYRLIERKYPTGNIEYIIQLNYCFVMWLDIRGYRELSIAKSVFKNLTEPNIDTILETT